MKRGRLLFRAIAKQGWVCESGQEDREELGYADPSGPKLGAWCSLTLSNSVTQL